MNEKAKNILTIILGILLIIFLWWYLVLAWELQTTKNELYEAQWFQRDVERVGIIQEEIIKNSQEWEVQEYLRQEELKRVNAKYDTKQAELQLKNNDLRKEMKEIQEKNLNDLGLSMRSQPQ